MTTKSIKQDSYSSNPSVLSLEDLISRCLEVSDYWDGYKYSNSQKDSLIQSLSKEIARNQKKPFITEYLQDKLDKLRRS
ncbi:hypothetical protein MHF_1318 [Mycoplasma haemofelis Ohio2]|uniref:Uncharacterized protein n=1 Tax=Mycoplasma haemofelis (strain Ohio2) TaxID=859194 RepID=F6FG56_MYCHI|nr:hypothetical protein MHF_1318 [Mycoplasma haemofelis Ohio2]